jgi:hypothetical protein
MAIVLPSSAFILPLSMNIYPPNKPSYKQGPSCFCSPIFCCTSSGVGYASALRVAKTGGSSREVPALRVHPHHFQLYESYSSTEGLK